ncbi:MAG: hypothetical protein H7Y01_01435 [Ferruginibacter sp.]|nr:hypothetical protein [Chitinophagaceae bacterium]
MRNSLQQKFRLAFIFFSGLQLSAFGGNAQRYQKEPQPELAWGIKVVTRSIQYDKNSLYSTDPTSIGLQSGIRYDAPLKIAADRYIDLVGQAGFLFCKAKLFDTTFFDPGTNRFIRQHSDNPAYLPVYFGVYNMSTVSLGVEVFYWKGLGTRDIWGIKFLSLGYNAKQFRLSAAGELYAQVQNGKNNGMVFSFDFFWKLIRNRD